MESEHQQSIEVGASTHIGKVRKHNEDGLKVENDLRLWIVADGMGGGSAGDIASALALSKTLEQVVQGATVVQAIESAHSTIIAGPAEGKGAPGMGSTIVALRFYDHAYEVAWVGDSRAYLTRNNKLTQLTRDHSLVQGLVDSGEITAAEARHHPQRNIITRVLGALNDGRAMPEMVSGEVQPEDTFLLCSDGLTGEVEDEQIKRILLHASGAQDAADQLVRAALVSGGRDNITAVVVIVNQP